MTFWRFLPTFFSDVKKFRMSTINAKGETLLDNSICRESFPFRRCLIPVDSFIEWRVAGKSGISYVFGMA
jgi:putative SOS response-associated peptidase YedK